MYERFTDRARKVMQLANQEAQRCNHEYIGTEHILVGLAKEGSGVAAMVLQNMGVKPLEKILRLVRDRITEGPDMVTMGKLPQTPAAKKAIGLSIDEAKNLQNNYVGTEHLLLGLIQQGEGIAAQVLRELSVTYDQTVLTIQELQAQGERDTEEGKESSLAHAWAFTLSTIRPGIIRPIADDSRTLMNALASVLEADPHSFSKRPCATCRAASALLGRSYGCIALAEKS